MAASRYNDDLRLKGGREVVSALSQRMRQQIWDCLRDDKISVFSVWGWEGVGKSRIVRQVVAEMEEFRESSRLFEVIIRIRAPGIESLGEKIQARLREELDQQTIWWKKDRLKILEAKRRTNRLMEVQMGIREALEIPESIKFSTAAKSIKDKLSGQKFLLIFEDVCESFELKEMGIPVITSGSKVVITTQSHEVCSKMGSQLNIKVEEWSEEDAWYFLQEETTDVATSIGFLTGDMVLKCFSYVSLFCRNGRSIDGDSLIEEYWRSEGFLDESFNDQEDNKEAASKRHGNVLLKELAKRCMVLLSSALSNQDYITLFQKELLELYLYPWETHPKEAEFLDRIREQITMEGSSGGRYYVDMNSHLRQVIDSQTFLVKYHLDREEGCQWISLSHNQVETLQFSSSNCPLLSTLLLNDNDRLQEIPDSFFKNMTRLRVLDLSSTSISSLPSSISCLCELRLLKLRSCHRLEVLPVFLKDMQKLEILDLHQTPLKKMVEASFNNMQTLRRLNISGACNLSRLSLKGCRSLLTVVSMDKLSKLEALDLSGTKMEELPHEIFNLTSMQCLDLLGMEHLKTVDWRKIDRLPEKLNWDRCGLDFLHEQLPDSSRRHISVSDASVFESLEQSSKLWKSCFLKFYFLICPCKGGLKDMYAHFKRNRFLYQHIFTRFEQSLSYERRLEVCGGKNSLDGVRGVLSVTEFFHLHGNAFIRTLSNLGMKMDNLKECWIEKCYQLEYLIVGGMEKVDAAVCLENLRVSDLAKLRTVSRGELGRGSFACLKHLHLECCPKLINFFSSSIRLQNLKLLEIKFCCRLEKVFEEDSVAGRHAFPQLVEVRLWELRKLESICSGQLPMLRKLKVRGCPMLEKLPLRDMSTSTAEVEIQGELKWWESIKWEGSIKPRNICFKEWCPSKRDGVEAMAASKDDDDDRRLRGQMSRQISERDGAEAAMAASTDGDDQQLIGGGEVVSSSSRHMRQQIWDCLRDDNISVFSVWGWHGVGKSRIVRQVVATMMEEFGESSRLFDVIIKVRAPGLESLAEKMQARFKGELNRSWSRLFLPKRELLEALDARGRRNRLMEVQMGIQEALEIPKSTHFPTAAKRILAKLSGQRFLLILEDVWEGMDLEEMGVPVAAPTTTIGSKVVITTRSQAVCSKMGAQVDITPGELSKEDAWNFLQEEATDVATRIHFLTGEMVLKCVSYVSLVCRNGHSIDGDSLIKEYWRSEGFMDGCLNEEENKEVTFKKLGNVLLKELAERCMLLVSLASSDPNYLRHYLDRHPGYARDTLEAQSLEAEFMNWLQEQFTMEGSSAGQYHVDLDSHVREVIDSQTFLVKYNLDGEEACQWISLSHNQVETLQFSSPNCPLLSTLLLNDNDSLQEISDSFFESMTRLRVLDLSFTSISSMPLSMSCLCELRLLKLRSCRKLEALPSFLNLMQKLEILDLYQTPLTNMVEASFDNMQSLRCLDISGACNLSRLSLKGCRSLLTLVSMDKLSKLEALDLSGTKMEELPHEIFNLTSMRCLDLLGMEHLKTVDWRKIVRLPKVLNWDRCGLKPRHEFQDSSRRRISVSDASVFESLDQSSRLWTSCFLKFCFLVCTCEGGHSKDISARFKRNRFLYQRIYARFEQYLSYERCLEVCGGKNSLNGIRGVLSVAEFFHLYGNDFIKALSDLDMEMGNLKECTIEKCHQLEYLIVGRTANVNAVVCLENLRVYDLAKLRTVCRGKLGRRSFTCLKQIHLECCPKLTNFFSSNIRLQNLELLKIKFCCRLEKVFEEDSVVGQNAFPRLVEFHLWELRKLKSICGGHLPMLKKLKIRGCPMLEKLPLCDTNASAAEVEIQGELKWWESIKWVGSVKPAGNIHFKEWRPSTK